MTKIAFVNLSAVCQAYRKTKHFTGEPAEKQEAFKAAVKTIEDEIEVLCYEDWLAQRKSRRRLNDEKIAKKREELRKVHGGYRRNMAKWDELQRTEIQATIKIGGGTLWFSANG